MAIATPVLERRTDTDEEVYSYSAVMSREEAHNARISDNYKKLINPETKIDEALGRSVPVETPVQEPVRSAVSAPVDQPVYVQRPYLVQNARATADIFRADSAVNARPVANYAPVQKKAPVVIAQADEEDENEDLRPTQTTIQYKTSAVGKISEEGKIENYGAEKHFTISKKEKITIGVIIGVIVALFTLIIINSAIISGINNDINTLQTSLNDAHDRYVTVEGQIDEYLDNIELVIDQYAKENNMVKVAE